MNNVRSIAKINERELELTLQGGGTGSWHDEFKDSAYIFVGGLPRELTEGDVITIFSQYGEVLDINLPRDKETGKKRGFGFLMYEDQRSTILAVDNINGSKVLERVLRVDHVREYRHPGQRDDEGKFQPPEQPSMNAAPQPLRSQEETDVSAVDPDLEDPMAAYFAQRRREEELESSEEEEEGKSRRKGTLQERAEKLRRKEERRRIREDRQLKRQLREHRGAKDGLRGDGTDRAHRHRSRSPHGTERGDARGSRERERRR